jgi:hypothetical protein
VIDDRDLELVREVIAERFGPFGALASERWPAERPVFAVDQCPRCHRDGQLVMILSLTGRVYHCPDGHEWLVRL